MIDLHFCCQLLDHIIFNHFTFLRFHRCLPESQYLSFLITKDITTSNWTEKKSPKIIFCGRKKNVQSILSTKKSFNTQKKLAKWKERERERKRFGPFCVKLAEKIVALQLKRKKREIKKRGRLKLSSRKCRIFQPKFRGFSWQRHSCLILVI